MKLDWCLCLPQSTIYLAPAVYWLLPETEEPLSKSDRRAPKSTVVSAIDLYEMYIYEKVRFKQEMTETAWTSYLDIYLIRKEFIQKELKIRMTDEAYKFRMI